MECNSEVNLKSRSGVIVQWVRTLTDFQEVLDSIPRTHTAAQSLSSTDALFWTLWILYALVQHYTFRKTLIHLK